MLTRPAAQGCDIDTDANDIDADDIDANDEDL